MAQTKSDWVLKGGYWCQPRSQYRKSNGVAMAQTKSDWVLKEIAKIDQDNVRSALKVASEHVNDGGMKVIVDYILKLQDEVHVLRRAKEFTDGWEDSPKPV